MPKLDYEVREFKFKEPITNAELVKLIDKLKKQGFDYEGLDVERHVYSFIKFNRK